MKRPTCTVWEIDHQNGTRAALGTYQTHKEANAAARQAAVERIQRTGIQTKAHTDGWFNFPDGVIIVANPDR